ncbi:MAG: Smr/MutS family protein [Pyrinomonadaceae bacterium]
MSLSEWFRRRLSKNAPRASGEDAASGASFDEDEDPDVDPFAPFPEPVTLEITDVFDLHTIPPRDVKRVVEAYLLEAHLKGFRSVRIIHGKGRGVQRATVRQVLARMPFVRDWTDAPPQAGGLGATVAHLRPDHDG